MALIMECGPWASFLRTAEFQAAHRALRRDHKAGFPTASGRQTSNEEVNPVGHDSGSNK